jgi:predicted RNA-binding Zn-ribbon protein involved in translation (DUF1610 family)
MHEINDTAIANLSTATDMDELTCATCNVHWDGSHFSPMQCPMCGSTDVHQYIAPISTQAARRIASEWHGGQRSALYSLASTGLAHGCDRMLEEVEHCIDSFKGEDADALMELMQLEGWLLEAQWLRMRSL